MTTVFTIGTTGKKSEAFVASIQAHGIKCILDIRRNNHFFGWGYAQRKELVPLLQEQLRCEYLEMKSLAPSRELLTNFKKQGMTWSDYAIQFRREMEVSGSIGTVSQKLFHDQPTCLLCACVDEHVCHRRLVAQMLARAWGETAVEHILMNGELAEWKPGHTNYPDDDLLA